MAGVLTGDFVSWLMGGGGNGDSQVKNPPAYQPYSGGGSNPLWNNWNISGSNGYGGGSYEGDRAQQSHDAMLGGSQAAQQFLRSIANSGGSFDFNSHNNVNPLDFFAPGSDRRDQLRRLAAQNWDKVQQASDDFNMPNYYDPQGVVKAFVKQGGMSKHDAQNALYNQLTATGTELDKQLPNIDSNKKVYSDQTGGKTVTEGDQARKDITRLLGPKAAAKGAVGEYRNTWNGAMQAFMNDPVAKASVYANNVLVPQIQEKIDIAKQKAQEYAAWLAGGRHGTSPITGFTTLFRELGVPEDMPITPENIWAAAVNGQNNIGGLMQQYLDKQLATQQGTNSDTQRLQRTLQKNGYKPTNDPVINRLMMLDAMKKGGLTWAPKSSTGSGITNTDDLATLEGL